VDEADRFGDFTLLMVVGRTSAEGSEKSQYRASVFYVGVVGIIFFREGMNYVLDGVMWRSECRKLRGSVERHVRG
jgi:hypothetical protein